MQDDKAGHQMETLQVTSVGYDGTVYIFPPWEDGSIQIMATTGSGSAVRVILNVDGVKRLADLLSEAVTAATAASSPSQARQADRE